MIILPVENIRVKKQAGLINVKGFAIFEVCARSSVAERPSDTGKVAGSTPARRTKSLFFTTTFISQGSTGSPSQSLLIHMDKIPKPLKNKSSKPQPKLSAKAKSAKKLASSWPENWGQQFADNFNEALKSGNLPEVL